MSMPSISIIAAIGKNTNALGKDNQLLWRISDDLKRFKALTTGHPVIMGRKTFESIGKPLPNRINIVITRNKEYKPEGCIMCSSVDEVLRKAHEFDTDEIFILGGGEIYTQALPFVRRLYLTIIDSDLPGDTFFPDYSEFSKIVMEEQHVDNDPPYSFVTREK